MNKPPTETDILSSPLSDCRTQSDRPSFKDDNYLQCLGDTVCSPTVPMTCSSAPAYVGMGKERFRSREVLLELLQPPSSSKMVSTCVHCMGDPMNQTNCNADAFRFRRRDMFEAVGSFVQPMPSQKCANPTDGYVREPLGNVKFGVCNADMASKNGKERSISGTAQHPCCLPETHPCHPDEFQIREFNSEQFVRRYDDEYRSGAHRLTKELHSTPSTTDATHREKQEKETAPKKATKEARNHQHRMCFSSLNCQQRRHPCPDISGHRMDHKQSLDRCHMECTYEMVKPLEFEGGNYLHRRGERYSKYCHAIPRDEPWDSTMDSSALLSFCPLRSNHGAWKTPFYRTAGGVAHNSTFEERKVDLEPHRHYGEDQVPPVQRGPRAKFDSQMTHPSRDECTPVIVECYSLSVMNSKNAMPSSRLQNTQSLNEEDTESILDRSEHVRDRCRAREPFRHCYQHCVSQSTKYAANQNDISPSVREMKVSAEPQRSGGRNGSQPCITATKQHNRLWYTLPDITPSGRHFQPPFQHYSHRTESHRSSMQGAEQGPDVQMDSWHDPIIHPSLRREAEVSHMPNTYQIKSFPEDATNHALHAFEYESTQTVQDYFKGRGPYQGICNSTGCRKTMEPMPSSFRNERPVIPGNHSATSNVFDETARGEAAPDLSFKQQQASVGSRKRKRRQPRPQRIKPCVIVSTSLPRQQNTSAVQNSQEDAFKTTASNQEISTSDHEASHFPPYDNQRVHAPSLSTPGRHELICISNGFSESSTFEFQPRGGYYGSPSLHRVANLQFQERGPTAKLPLRGINISSYDTDARRKDPYKKDPVYESRRTYYSAPFENELPAQATFKCQEDVGQGINPEFLVSQPKGTLSGTTFNINTDGTGEVKQNDAFFDAKDVSNTTFEKSSDCLEKDGDNTCSLISAQLSLSSDPDRDTTKKERDKRCYTNFKLPCQTERDMKSTEAPVEKERRFHCRFCSKRFAHFSTLQNHLRTHTGDKPFQCRFCSRRFAQSGVLKAHLRTHTGDKPFSCLFCGKMFAQSTTLTNHLRTHTGQKPYKCRFCGKSFSQPSTLRKHELSHTKERPYPCKFCGKAFAQHSTLTNHLRSHTGQKPYKCHFCDKCFAQLSTLDRHLHLHTTVSHKPHACKYCGKSFSYLSNLASHVKLHEQARLEGHQTL